MIIKLLATALLSFITISPSIQNNNIEHLIVPNIEIQVSDVYRPLTEVWDTPITVNWQGFTWIYRLGDYNKYLHLTFDNNTISFANIRYILSSYHNALSFQISNIPNTSALATTGEYGGAMPTGGYFLYNVLILPPPADTTPPVITGSSSLTFQLGTYTLIEQLLNNFYTFTDNVGIENAYYFPITSISSVGVYNITVFATDLAGNQTNLPVTINVTAPPPPADSTPPVITSITGNPSDWTNQNVTLTINATDNVSLGDLNTPPYSFDDGVTYQYTNNKTFSVNQFVNIRVRDLAGNFTNQQVTINKIDKSSPSVTLPSGWVNQYVVGSITSQQLLATYNLTDNQSGLNNSLTTISNFNGSLIGSYNPLISVTDNVGNTYNFTSPIVTIVQPADTTPPTITGSSVQTRQFGNITTEGLLSSFSISDINGVVEIRIQRLDNTIVTSWTNFNVGSHQLNVYARDTVGNIALYPFELVITAPPPPDTIPPVITGSLITSFVLGTYTSTNEILALYTITDNVAVAVQQLVGTINFEMLGDYSVTITATDTSNNTSTKDIVVRIRQDVALGNYNPLTDLLSGIFGALLSMIFTIGTINVLGFRLLDGMGIIILGFVIFMIYKVIRGGK